MKTAILAFIGFAIATYANFIPGVRSAQPNANATRKEKVKFYVKKYKKYLGLAGGLLGAIAAYRASDEQDIAQATIVQKSDTIATLNRIMLKRQIRSDVASIQQYKKLLDEAIGQRDQTALLLKEEMLLRQKTEKIQDLQSRLNIRSDKIASLSEELYNTTTGKGSFCYIKLMPVAPNLVEVVLYREGEYPIQGLQFNIVNDVKNIDLLLSGSNEQNFTADRYEKMTHIIKQFELRTYPTSKNTVIRVGTIPFSWPEDSSLTVNYQALNGFWTQFISRKLNAKGQFEQNSVIYMRSKESLSKNYKNILLKTTQDRF